MEECPSGMREVVDSMGNVHCFTEGDSLTYYVMAAWFALIFGLWFAGWLRGKLWPKPLTVDGWTLRKGFWEKD